MTWKHFINERMIASRRRGFATATLYGLSLAIRFTSATGEEVEIPAHDLYSAHKLVSIMRRDGSGLPYQDWGPQADQSVVFRQGRPPSSSLSRCVSP